jgi:hypothetical protein
MFYNYKISYFSTLRCFKIYCSFEFGLSLIKCSLITPEINALKFCGFGSRSHLFYYECLAYKKSLQGNRGYGSFCDSRNLTQMYCGLERLCGSKGENSDSDAFIICCVDYNFLLVCRNTHLPSVLLKSFTLKISLCQKVQP